MTAQILSPIQPQQFERIRERLGEILRTELSSQRALLGSDGAFLQGLIVWVERSVAFDKTEAPSINVTLSRGEYDGGTVRHQEGTYTFWIDIRTNAKFKTDRSGDQLAMMNSQRVAGLVRAVLMNPAYLTLGFVRPSITAVKVGSMAFADDSNQDATSEARGRVEVTVKANEGVALKSALPLTGTGTTVHLYQTNRGYLWAYQQEAADLLQTEEGLDILTEDGQPIAIETNP